MPTSLLTDKTVLQTSDGWIAPDGNGQLDGVIGVNRRGAHSTSSVNIEITEEATAICYLGTRAAFGGFHPQTKLITASGTINAASDIVARDEFDGVHFELAIDFSSASSMCNNISVVWNHLSAGVVVKSDDNLIYRIVSNEKPPGSLGKVWFSLNKESGSRYASIDKTGFLASLKREGPKILWDLLSFTHLEDGVVRFERGNYALALWCITHLESVGQKFRLTYDTIQHSSMVAINLNEKCSRIEQIRTAFVAHGGRVVRLSWDDHQWNPIAAGFAITG